MKDSTIDQRQNFNATSKTDLTKKKWRQKVRDFFANPKKRLIFWITLGIITIALFGLGLYFLTHEPTNNNTAQQTTDSSTPDQTKELQPSLYQAPLDGIMASLDSANNHPLAVMIENHTEARPQAGLDKASIVYEAIAEGGITRFMALYGTNSAEKVGPVRSARTYYVDWALGYDAYYAHVGGNINALDQIKADKVLDLDQFAYPASYWRERKAGVSLEHTMYASTIKLREQAENNGYPKANNFNVLRFKDEPTETERLSLPDSQLISIDYSSPTYNVQFQYDKNTNSYKRLMAGKPHIDQITKDQLSPKNIIVMTLNRKQIVSRDGKAVWEMTTVGSGPAKIFLDGKTINGTWKKSNKGDREIFYDDKGEEITFNRGQFWISVVHSNNSITIE
ncbi:MAG: putative lipoprotein YerB precursor [bacterium ADurb.Bin400]|nr:MAG: putative lipoprotein YerB precursor [bacterium ADurb.Bin400]